MKEQEELIGVVERITFHSEESGYTVLKVALPRKNDLVCCVGHTNGVQAGETIVAQGIWTNHTVHGRQFAMEKYETKQPADIYGIKKYLSSGLVKGIGPVMAERIVEEFGAETLIVIDQFPNRLSQIPGIGAKRVKQIQKCWKDQKAIAEVMVFLRGHDVSPSFAQKIYKAYGTESIEKVTNNPYALARDIHGIGFRSADKIAESLHIAKESTERLEAGVEYQIKQLADMGHTCYPVQDLLEQAGQVLSVDQELLSAIPHRLEKEQRIVIAPIEEELFAWIRPLYLAEKGIAREVERIQQGLLCIRKIDTKKAVEWVQQQLKIHLAKNQESGVETALEEKLAIITGGPGTGKSTITKAILQITAKLTKKILLAAPTGRAAKRMTEITYWRASTCHSLLEYSFQQGGFKKNNKNPLDCDLLIIDEASMIDTFLLYHLLRAVPDHARVILIGDVNQLPSVGPGNVLKDLIASKKVPVVELTEIYRQAKGSQIIVNAHKINQGEFPYLSNREKDDFFFLEANEPEQVLTKIVDLVSHRVPTRFHFDPIEDIQVLSPMKKGVVGTHQLNDTLQKTLNPATQEPIIRFGQRYLPGDKVMQIRNNYNKEVFNGDIGIISSVNPIDGELVVFFEGKSVCYDLSDLDELVLAYAVSIHKYQGSEAPCIILPVHTTHFKLLHKNLLYTGVTRGKKLVILVGSKKALAIAVRTDDVSMRHTGLQTFVNGLPRTATDQSVCGKNG